ncbi:hypothetical protein C0991_002944 [Blastosporella zonata]|nr:hypothetical protein C0991_002944 [Blastosporella zonata]
MAQEALRTTLRPTEDLKALLHTIIVRRPADSFGPGETIQAIDEEDTRILAVVVHKGYQNVSTNEKGGLFICAATVAEDPALYLDIEHVFPLAADFSISVAQTKEFISGPNGISNERITDDAENVSATSQPNDFQWLLPYVSDRGLPPLFDLIPQDLRLASEPLHTRLSPAFAGLPGDDVGDFRLIRDEWIRIQAREASRKGQHVLKLRLGTFNVNGNLPSQDLSGWMATKSTSTSVNTTAIPPLKEGSPLTLTGEDFGSSKQSPTSEPENPITTLSSALSLNSLNDTDVAEADPDILVLGFQELDLSTEALVYSTGTAREDAWCQAVFAALARIKATGWDADCRIMGIMGNKGGTAVRLTFTPPASDTMDLASCGPTTLTFVNSHLAAFDEMYEKRNLDFQDLSKRFRFDSGFVDATGPFVTTAYESDVLFWMVNDTRLFMFYRLTLMLLLGRFELSRRSSRRGYSRYLGRSQTGRGISDHPKIRSGMQCSPFEEQDTPPFIASIVQLKKAKHTGRAFTGFYEHPITHPPTYRFSPDLETDSLGYDIKRKPAWTDRILHMAGKNVRMQQLSYTGHPQITMSDHRPVAADFVLGVDVYDKDVHSNTCRKLSRIVARMEDYSNKAIKLDKTSIDMGNIS